MVPTVVLAVEAARLRAGPWGDQAVIQLATDRAAHLGQLVGPYSRFGWNHPGPLYFYLLALPYRLAGSDARAMVLASVVLVGLSALVAVGLGGALAGRTGARWTAAVVVAEMAALGTGVLYQVWNPVAVILPTTAFLLAAASVAAGRRWCLPWASGLACFLVETDVSTALVVAVVGVACLAVGLRRTRPLRAWAVPAATGALTVILLWMAPLVQEVGGSKPNLTVLVRFFAAGHAGHPVGDAVRSVAGALWPPLAGRLSAPPPALAPSALVVGGCLLLGVVLVAVGRRRDGVAWAPGLAVVGAVAAGVVAAGRVVGPLFAYLVEWLSAAAAVMVLGWVLVAAGATRWARLAGAGAVAASAALCGVALTGPVPDTTAPAQVAALWASVGPRLPAGPVQVRITTADRWPWAAGLLVDLSHAGHRASVEAGWQFLFGTPPPPRPGEAGAVMSVWRPGAGRPPGGRAVGRSGDTAVYLSPPSR